MSTVISGPTQAAGAPLTSNAVFLIVNVTPSGVDTVRETLTGLADTMKAITFRFPDAGLTCTVGIGTRVWTSGRHCTAERASRVHTGRGCDAQCTCNRRRPSVPYPRGTG